MASFLGAMEVPPRTGGARVRRPLRDGTRLVYTRYETGYEGATGATTDVVVYDFTSQSETQLTQGGESYYAIWSPDGTQIAFLLEPGVREARGVG
jgi:Tol biopolymer transport system component